MIRGTTLASELVIVLVLSVITALVFMPPVDAMLVEDIAYDYFDQVRDAEQLFNTGQGIVARPNLLFQRSLMVVQSLGVPITWMQTALVITLIYDVLTVVVIYCGLRLTLRDLSWGRRGLYAAIALLLLLATSLYWFTCCDYDPMYIGYTTYALYHNPTTHLARFFALLQFGLGLLALRSTPFHLGVWIAGVVITALSLDAKFSFTAAFLPALILLALWKLYHRRELSGWLIITMLITTIPILWFQFQIGFGTDTVGVTVALFGYYRASGNLDVSLPFKWILSIAFPLVVFAADKTLAYRATIWQLAWGTFGIALLQAILLMETGYRMAHGNFAWGVRYATLILFVVAGGWLLYRWQSLGRWQKWMAGVVLGLHIATGVHWWWVNVLSKPL